MKGLVCIVMFVISLFLDGDRSGEMTRARARLDDGVLRAVVLGDSVARGAGDERRRGISGVLDEQFRALGLRAASAVNLGINGARTANIRELLEKETARSIIRTSDVIVLSIGGNDMYGDTAARLLSRFVPYVQQRRTLANVEAIVAKLRTTNPAAHIYVLGLYNPYRDRGFLSEQVNLWDARLITRFASTPNVTVVRICDLLQRNDRISTLDHFHPGSRGYEAIASRITASIQPTS